MAIKSKRRQALYITTGLIAISLLLVKLSYHELSDPSDLQSRPNYYQNKIDRKQSGPNGQRSEVMEVIKTKKPNLKWSKMDQYKLFKREKEVGQRQRLEVDKFCRRYNRHNSAYKLPQYRDHPIYRKLLLSRKSKTVFCIAPKAGSITLQVLYFIATGELQESYATISRNKIMYSELRDLVLHHSFDSASPEERHYALKRYFKFMMYRNPLERLVSAYRSKVEQYPLIGLNQSEPHYNWFRMKIHNHTSPLRYQRWMENGGQNPVRISFSDFIDFWLTTTDYKAHNDPHFAPLFDLCQPCRVRYSFYGDFDNFEDDATILIRQVGVTPLQLREGYYTTSKNSSTSNLTHSLYDQLTVEQKKRVLKVLSRDINFYYHIFPSKTDSHKQILELNVGLSTPRSDLS